jgi:RNA polymerase sigma factor for flagellar operon FliA
MTMAVQTIDKVTNVESDEDLTSIVTLVDADGMAQTVRPTARKTIQLPPGGSTEANALAVAHLWLVDRMAANLARRFPTHIDRSDLWSAGVVGLVEASRRFDPSLGVPFPSYASARVRGEIMEAARGRDMASRRLRRTLRELGYHADHLSQTLGRPATRAEIAEAAGVDESTVRARMQDLVALSDTRSLDADLQSGIVEPAEVRPDAAWQLEEAELMGSVREAVSALPEPLRSIVARSYWGNARLVDIAADMGITTQRVAQYRAEAITALSAWFSRLYEEVSAPDDHSPGQARRAQFCATLAATSTWQARLSA